MCAPQRKNAQSLVVVNVTTMSPLPEACVGAVMLSTVPPYIVRFRATPEKAIAPFTVSPGETAGDACVSAAPGVSGECEDAPREVGAAHLFGFSVTFQVARKSYASLPPVK